MVISTFICFLTYFGVSAALTLMVPYYQIHHYSPLPQAFLHVGWDPARYIMAVVFLCALLYRSVSWFSPCLLSDSWVSCPLALRHKRARCITTCRQGRDASLCTDSLHPLTCFLPSSLLGSMFVMSQLICEMANDRLLFWDLAQIHARTGTPVMAITASGFLAGK